MTARTDPYVTDKAARFARDRQRALAHLRGAAESIDRAREIITGAAAERELELGGLPDWQTTVERARSAAEAAQRCVTESLSR